MTEGICHTFQHTSSGAGLFYGWFEAMHTRLDLLLVGFPENEASALCRDMATEIRRIEKRLNRFDDESDVRQMNLNTFYDKCPADPELLGIFADALRYGQLTQQAFDIAIQTPGYQPGETYFLVDYACEAVVKLHPETIFDFGGYAKGYALQNSLAILQQAGVTTALVSFGNSSVCGVGSHPSGACWQIGVENPLRRGENMATLNLCDTSLSTSGNTPHNRGHIHAPQTGEAVTSNRIISVTGASPLECEVLSTALFATDTTHYEAILRHFSLSRVAMMDFSASGYILREILNP